MTPSRPPPTHHLDDDQLQTLLGLAGEAERMEAAHDLRIAARSTTRPRALLLAASLALAAGLLAVWMLTPGSPVPQPQFTSNPQPVPGDVRQVTAVLPTQPDGAPVPSSAAVVLAIAQSDNGDFRCVRWSPPQWAGRSLSEVTNEELQSVGLSMVCDNLAQRLLVVGMQGPTAKLPASDQSAIQMAQCVLTAPGCGTTTFDPQVCRATGCVPGDVTVRVESVALAGR